MAGFFFTGEQDLTPEGLDRKRVLLNALRKDNLSTAPVGHWTQALARVVGSTADTLEEGQLARTEKSKTEEARNLLMKHLGIGGAVSPGEPTAAAGVPPSSPAAATPAPKSALPIMAQQDPTAALIRSFEGYRDKPYWDVNAHRVGYGSDTITNPDGSVQKVQPGMQINRQQAELDLQRRISTEFQPRAASAVGENWAKLPPQAQAALTSITYNYGSLPKSVAAAAQSGDPNAIAQAVEGLAGHNGGINANRRMQEAALIRGADMPSQGAQTAEQTLARPAAGQFAIPTQAAQPNAQALMAALSNPWAARSPALMQLAASVAGKQLSRDPVEDALKRVQLQQGIRELEQPKAEWGIISEDEFGNKKYGWIDKNARTTTPGQPAAPAQGAPPPVSGPPMPGQPAPAQGIPPAPPGVNPKVWRDEYTKKLVNPEKLTEVQSKDLNFYQRGVPANEILSKVEKALTNPLDPTLAKLPGGNYAVSKDFQIAQNAAKDFLAVILRKDTGAAVTESEVETYGKIFLPERGDAPETIAQKREARARALEGIRLGLGSAKELVEFARPKGQQAAKPDGAPVRVNTPAEAAKLPKGTRFVDPNGIERIVP